MSTLPDSIPVASAAEMEALLVEASARGDLVLTAAGRLARRVLHAGRLARTKGPPTGWEGPRVHALGSWTRAAWDSLWEGRRPMTFEASLALWHRAAHEAPPPEGIVPSPSLYLGLQRTLDALGEAGLDPLGPPSDTTLSAWRREATRVFLRLARREALATWPEMVDAVARGLDEGRIAAPGRVMLAGFASPTPLEGRLLEALCSRATPVLVHAARSVSDMDAVRVFASPEAEALGVCAEVLEAWNAGEKNLGVAAADPALLEGLGDRLLELAGREPLDLARAIRFNLVRATPLPGHPLAATALLPIRALGEPRPAACLGSLLASPFVERRFPGWDAALREAIFEAETPLTFDAAVRELGRRGFPVAGLAALARRRTAPLERWISDLMRVLTDLGFPVMGTETRETEAKVWTEHLPAVLDALVREGGDIQASPAEALAWITAAAESRSVAQVSPETAGIQVLPLREAGGLSFDRLWIVGLHGEALPETVIDDPFLPPSLRREIRGGTPESRWAQGLQTLEGLLAGSARVLLSRAAAEGSERPLLPCPLVGDESGTDAARGIRTAEVWREPHPAWVRWPWLRQGFEGLGRPAPAVTPRHLASPLDVSQEIRVTALQSLLDCPFSFFAGQVLGLAAPEAPEEGLSPRVRGTLVHTILAAFLDGLRANAPGWPAEPGEAEAWLRRCAEAELAKGTGDAYWRAERDRLLGGEEGGGLLPGWLALERERALQGWRMERAEVPFDGLPLGPLTLRGRVDRVDRSERDGARAVWDYKTGRAPAGSGVLDGRDAQIPAYVAAVLREDPASGVREAGYVSLRSEEDLRAPSPVRLGSPKEPLAWPEALGRWRAAVLERASAPLAGRFDADPNAEPGALFSRRRGTCEHCAFHLLCGRWDEAGDGDDEPGEDEP